MKRKMFSILTSSALLLQGGSLPTLAVEPKFAPMEEVKNLTETKESTSPEERKGTIGNSDVTWEIKDRKLIIGAGEFENTDLNFKWPWEEFSEEIEEIDGTASFTPIGIYHKVFSAQKEFGDSFINLKKVDLSGWNTSQVTDMSSMFRKCRALTSLTLSSNWDTSKVTNMAYMFYECFALETLDISDWDTSRVTNMEWMFYRCETLASLDLSRWNTSKVTNMRHMFSFLHSLSSLDVSGWDTSKVTNMEGMFSNCKSLTSLDVNNWDTSKVTNMAAMFYQCNSLISLDLSNWDVSNVTNIGGIFEGCNSLYSLDVSNWDTSNVTNMNQAFAGTSLVSLDLSNWDTSNVTDMSWMFAWCESLTSLNISSWDTSNVTNMKGMFALCEYLNSLDLSHWDTSKVTNMREIFSACKSLNYLDLSNWNTLQITDEENIFISNNALKKIKYTSTSQNLVQSLLKTDIKDLIESNKIENLNWSINGKTEVLSFKDDYFDQSLSIIENSLNLKIKEIGVLSLDYENNSFSLIKQIPISNFDIVLSPYEFIYNGSPQTPTVTVLNEEMQLEEGTDYTVSYLNHTNSGTAQVVVAGIGNYEGTIRENYTIKKATPTSIVWSSIESSLPYTGETIGIKANVILDDNSQFNGELKYSYVEANMGMDMAAKEGLPKNAGIYKITATIAEQLNYNSATSIPLNFEIAKAKAPESIIEMKNHTQEETVSIDIASKLPKDRGKTTYCLLNESLKNENSILNEKDIFIDDNGILSYSVLGTNEGDASIIIEVRMQNYEDTNYTLNVNFTKPIFSNPVIPSPIESKPENPKEENNGSSSSKENDNSSTSNEDDNPKPDEGNSDLSSSEEENPVNPSDEEQKPNIPSNDPIDSSDKDQNPSTPSEDEDPKPSSPSVEDPEPTPPVSDAKDPSEDLNQNDLDDQKQEPNDSDDNIPYIPTPTTGEALSITLNLSVRDIEGVTTENGKLPEDELVALEAHINKTPDTNPYGYAISITEASVTKNDGKYDFKLTVTVKLKNESKINLIFNNLKKKLSGREAALITLENEEKSYEVVEKDDLVIIKGITVEEAFNGNEINSTLIKKILSEKDYETDELDFSSTPTKDSSFALEDLTAPIAIQIALNTKVEEPTKPTTQPSSNSSSSKPYHKPTQSVVPTTLKRTVYRLYNRLTGEHLYTVSEDEYNQLLTNTNWSNENQGWMTPELSDFPIYRLVNPNTGEHHYTMNQNEYDTLQTLGWQGEGIGLYSADSGDSDVLQLHRLYNPNAKNAGSHHYTVDENERDSLVQQGWNYEGIAWYGLKSK